MTAIRKGVWAVIIDTPNNDVISEGRIKAVITEKVRGKKVVRIFV